LKKKSFLLQSVPHPPENIAGHLPSTTFSLYNTTRMETIFSLDTTIFAWATPIAPAARAILRVSGPQAFSALKTLFTPDRETGDLRKTPHQTLPGTITLEGSLKLRAWLWVFPEPKSYTGQDLLELHTLSSPPLGKLIEHELLRRGLTAARPGEFSARAFLLGKMDLTQAQAVQQLVTAQNDAQIHAALNLLAGSFHQHLDKIYRELADLAVALEANIDFSEEQIETITFDQTITTIESQRTTLANLLNQAVDTRSISSLPRVFLIGIANAGKSTLLNHLTGIDRAICSPLPGTTRDILTAIWRHGQKELLLCDTPGLLHTPTDEITRSAIERVGPFLPLADLGILVFDPTQDLDTQLQLFQNLNVNINKSLIVLNKTDLKDGRDITQKLIELERRGADIGDHSHKNIFPVSARTGQGVRELTAMVFDRLSDISLTTAAQAIAIDRRGRDLLESTLACLNQAATDAQTLENNKSKSNRKSILGLEIIAVDIQQALRTLGSLLGKDVTEDVLENIFSKFCIGK
jgi:tRNA modification GTPase